MQRLSHPVARMKPAAVVAVAALAWAAQAAAGELLIEQRLASDGALLVSYTPPEGVRELPLFDRSATMSTVWGEMATPADRCAAVVLSPRPAIQLQAGCTSASFRIAPRLLNRYAVYEPAFAVGKTAVMSYGGFYAAALPGHALRWRWVPEGGARAIVAGRVHAQPVDRVVTVAQVAAALQDEGRTSAGWDALAANEYAFLGQAPLETLPGGVLVNDGAVDATRLQAVHEALARTTERLASAYGVPPAGPWAVVASAAPGLRGFRGDVTAGRMMSLRIDDAVPQGVDATGRMHRFVAHEVTHWWDTGVYRVDFDHPWIHEGHAEWMAGLLMREAGLQDAERWRGSQDAALNSCQFARGDRPSATLPTGFNREDDTYACGQVLMLLAQSARPRDTAPVDVAASLFRGSTTPVDAVAIARWADGGDSGPMHRLLLDPKQGFVSALKRDWANVVDVTDLKAGAPLPAGLRSRLGTALMGALMTADCGRMGFWTEVDHFRIEAVPECRTLRGDLRVRRIAGLSPFDDPVGAWQAARAACEAGRPVELGTVGEPVSLACPAPVPDMPIQHVLRLRPQALERLGLAP